MAAMTETSILEEEENAMRVEALRLRPFQEDEIRRRSVCEVTEVSLYAQHVPRPNGLMDLRMGRVDRRFRCATCERSMDECGGHPGHMELPVPLYHPLFINEILKTLRSVCYHCGYLLVAPPSEPLTVENDRSRKFRQKIDRILATTAEKPLMRFGLITAAAKNQVCPECGERNPAYHKYVVNRFFEIRASFNQQASHLLLSFKTHQLVRLVQCRTLDNKVTPVLDNLAKETTPEQAWFYSHALFQWFTDRQASWLVWLVTDQGYTSTQLKTLQHYLRQQVSAMMTDDAWLAEEESWRQLHEDEADSSADEYEPASDSEDEEDYETDEKSVEVQELRQADPQEVRRMLQVLRYRSQGTLEPFSQVIAYEILDSIRDEHSWM